MHGQHVVVRLGNRAVVDYLHNLLATREEYGAGCMSDDVNELHDAIMADKARLERLNTKLGLSPKGV